MKNSFRISLIVVAAIFLAWYLSLYFSDSSRPFEVIESIIPLNKCILEDSPWILKSPELYNAKNKQGVFICDGLPKEPETRIWQIDIKSKSCVRVPEGMERNQFEPIPPSEEKIYPISYPSFYSEYHVIQRTEYHGGLSAQFCFRGFLVKRPVYRLRFLSGGRPSWGISQSHIGNFFLEVYQGKKKLFVIGDSVYGATWGPTVTLDYLTYDSANKMVIFTDKYSAKGIIYWAHLDE
ncbi:MAG: hypothetical protein U0V70_11070 [Terriglobia bacterium]